MTPYKLKIVTPDKMFFHGDTEQIVARTTEGDVGILAKHTSYIANLPAGPLKVKVDGQYKTAAISGGVLIVTNDLVSVLATSAEWEDDINLARAKEAEQRALNMLKSVNSGSDFENAKLELKRAVNRINIASKWARRNSAVNPALKQDED